jgi:hypothetical protein
MKIVRAVLLSMALVAATAPGIAQARGGHGGHHGGHFGGFGWGLAAGALIAAPLIAGSYLARPYYAPPYAYAPNYGYAPVYVQPTYAQPVYAQPYSAPAQQQANAWYFCPSSNGYYPYVRQCPGGWEQVPTTPPGN